MKKTTEEAVIVGIIIVIVGLVLLGVILTSMNIEKGGSSDRYDFECLTTPTQQPLKDCKQ